LIALLLADIWPGMSVFNAVFRSGGTGGLFLAADVILARLLILSFLAHEQGGAETSPPRNRQSVLAT
jgi:hypothetical protein